MRLYSPTTWLQPGQYRAILHATHLQLCDHPIRISLPYQVQDSARGAHDVTISVNELNTVEVL